MMFTPAAIGAKLLGLFLPIDLARKFAPLGFAFVLIAAALALWGMAALYIGSREDAAVEADRAAANEETLAKDAAGDEAAQGAATGVVDGVEAGNERALEAAEGSDDPLADGLRGL